MSNPINRRRFFRQTGQTLMAGGAAAYAQGKPVESGEDYYAKLGVTPFINAAGAFTFLSGSTLPPVVEAAMTRAAQKPVNIDELQRAAGEYLARRLHCEAALITSGAAAALTLGTAACLTRGNPQAILKIPADLSGLKNEVIVQKTHRYGYDHALLNCGIKFVEVETLEEYESAFSERTVLAHFFNAAEGGRISREDWVRVAHRHDVPCFNDAAADIPPVANLWNYTQMGFDLVAFSGGKGIRGPQCTGLLLGRKELIQFAVQNDSPISNTIGRGMKVGKEEIVGLVAAVDWLLGLDEPALLEEARRRAERIAGRLRSIPSVEARVFVPPVANHISHLLITYDGNRIPITGQQIMEKLRQGSPRIELNPVTGGGPYSAGMPSGPYTVVVCVWLLEPHQDLIVARRLSEVLHAALRT
jgi:L-seryl-tRNA(Ser) seleniumtransferase